MQPVIVRLFGAALLAACALAGCGGGGESEAPSKSLADIKLPVTTLSGVFDGRITDTAQPATTLLQADGSYYIVYSNGATQAPQGVVLGTGALAFSSFSSNDARDLSLVGNGAQEVVQGSVSASYAEESSFNGTLAMSNGTRAFTGAYNDSFTRLPTLAQLAGVYEGSIATRDLKEENITLTIDSNGRLAGELSCGCTVNATLAPRDDGTSYVATLAFTGGDHPLSNRSMAGNVYLDSATRRLYIVGYLGTVTQGAVFVGTKS